MDKPRKVDYTEKAWGRTACVALHSGFTVHHLVVEPGTRCSRHHHKHRFNGFFVTRGEMTVREFTFGFLGQLIAEKETSLRAGDYYEVSPLCQHRFESVEGCEALELYFPPEVDEEDIVRADVGGKL